MDNRIIREPDPLMQKVMMRSHQTEAQVNCQSLRLTMLDRHSKLLSMKDYYVYALIDPNKNKPFYIGKGRGKRAQSHLWKNTWMCENKRCKGYINNLRLQGVEPKIEILFDNLTPEEAFDKEANLIIKFGRRGIDALGCLMNLAEGGRGANGIWKGRKHTEEAKKKISDKLKNRVISEEQKVKISNTLKNRIITKEHAAKISVSLKGKPKTKEHVSKMADKKRGVPLSKEHKEKLSKATKGKPKSEEHKRRIKEGWLNRIRQQTMSE